MKAWRITIWLDTDDSVDDAGFIEETLESGCLSDIAKTGIQYQVEERLYG